MRLAGVPAGLVVALLAYAGISAVAFFDVQADGPTWLGLTLAAMAVIALSGGVYARVDDALARARA